MYSANSCGMIRVVFFLCNSGLHSHKPLTGGSVVDLYMIEIISFDPFIKIWSWYVYAYLIVRAQQTKLPLKLRWAFRVCYKSSTGTAKLPDQIFLSVVNVSKGFELLWKPNPRLGNLLVIHNVHLNPKGRFRQSERVRMYIYMVPRDIIVQKRKINNKSYLEFPLLN